MTFVYNDCGLRAFSKHTIYSQLVIICLRRSHENGAFITVNIKLSSARRWRSHFTERCQ